MKKFIAALTLMLAFTINANAQEKKELTSAEKAKKEATALSQYLGLNETQTADFERLFEQKHRTGRLLACASIKLTGVPSLSEVRQALS